MRLFLITWVLLALVFPSRAQLTAKVKCPDFSVDILNGKVNGLKADATQDDIKKEFPCFTQTEPDGSPSKCGGTVFYKDRDLSFYTQRDYVEIGPKFKGKLSLPLMGAARSGLFKWLGNPKIKDDAWDAFQMSYGTLVLYYDKSSKVRLIQFSTLPAETLSLCQ